MQVGKRLQEARKAKGLTQEEFGKMLGLSKSTICCYENGNRGINVETLIKAMEILGVTSEYILGTDVIAKDIKNNKFKAMTKEEMIFIEEIRKNKLIYEILFDDPKRGIELIKKKIG